MKNLTVGVCFAFLALCIADRSFAQPPPSLPSLRIDQQPQIAGPASAFAMAWDFHEPAPVFDSKNPPQNLGNSIAAVSATAAATQGNATAFGTTLGEAGVDPASGGSVFQPQANATVGGAGQAIVTGGFGMASANWSMDIVRAQATMEIQGIPSYPSGPADASETVTVVAAGGDHPLPGRVTVSAAAGGSNLMAVSMGASGWQIMGVRQRSSFQDPMAPAEMINFIVPGFGGVNYSIVGTELTAVGATLGISAQVDDAADFVMTNQVSLWSFTAHGSFTANAPPP